MSSLISELLATLASVCRTRAALQWEILALRHQLGVLQRSSRTRPRLTPADRILWAWLSRIWADWPTALVIVKPETVVAWHRKGFRLFWTGKKPSPRGSTDRPARCQDADSHDVESEPTLGSTSRSRGTAQAGHRHRG